MNKWYIDFCFQKINVQYVEFQRLILFTIKLFYDALHAYPPFLVIH